MGNGLLTERGSAGIDMILLSFLILVFLAVPLLMSVFEVYTYVMQGAVWSAATENVLDQVEWQIQTEGLSACERILVLEETRQTFAAHFDGVKGEREGTAWSIQALSYGEQDPPSLAVKVRIRYEPVTMVGLFIGQGSPLAFDLYREREFPIDR